MGRGRIPMELIQKEKARRTTFQKRKNGLMKKAYEFSTLCGVDVCAIIYAPKFDGEGVEEPETWPNDLSEIQRIIEKYENTTSDRRPKMYDVLEYYKDRMKKIEAEISKVCKEKLKIMYPTWDDSYNYLGQEQLRMLVNLLDTKLNACNQRIHVLKRDLKEKAITESDVAETLTTYMALNSSSHFNPMQNMPQAQVFPLPMKSISDNNQLACCPFQLGQSSQSPMFHFGQNCTQLMGKNGMVDWVDQVTCDPKTSTLKDGAGNNQNSSECYYNANRQAMQEYTSIALQPLPSQSQYEAAFQTLPDLPPGFQLNGFYDSNMLQGQMFTYMHGKK